MKVPKTVERLGGDFACVEQRHQGEWSVITYLGPERRDGRIAYMGKSPRLRLRFLRSVRIRKYAVALRQLLSSVPEKKHPEAVKLCRRLLTLLDWWARYD